MVTEIKSKCYTCLDPNALADPFDSASLYLLSKLWSWSPKTALRLNSIIDHTNNQENVHEANMATIRTVHQSYKNNMKSL